MYRDEDALYLTDGENDELEYLLNEYVDKARQAVMDCEAEIWDLQDKFTSDVKDFLGVNGSLTDVSIFCPDAISEPRWHGVWINLDGVLDKLDGADMELESLLGYL